MAIKSCFPREASVSSLFVQSPQLQLPYGSVDWSTAYFHFPKQGLGGGEGKGC